MGKICLLRGLCNPNIWWNLIKDNVSHFQMNKLLQKIFAYHPVVIKKLNGYVNENYLVKTESEKYIFKTYQYSAQIFALVEAENKTLLKDLEKQNKEAEKAFKDQEKSKKQLDRMARLEEEKKRLESGHSQVREKVENILEELEKIDFL